MRSVPLPLVQKQIQNISQGVSHGYYNRIHTFWKRYHNMFYYHSGSHTSAYGKGDIMKGIELVKYESKQVKASYKGKDRYPESMADESLKLLRALSK